MKDYSLISRDFHNYEQEKRYNKRVELNGIVNYYFLNGEKKPDELHLFDISICGLGFVSKNSFSCGDVLEFVIEIPNYITMQIMCYVVWRGLSDKGFIYGAMFVSMNNLNSDIIKMYINERIS
jgi:PilZ domain.